MNDAQWIEKLIEQQDKLLDAKLAPIIEAQQKTNAALFGNGKPGLIKRVDEHERMLKSIYAKGAIAVTVLAFIFAGIWELVKEFMKSKIRL